MQTQIEVTVDPSGATKVEAKNVVGASCTGLTSQLEKDLGVQASDQKKAEFFQQAQTVKAKQ